MFTTANAVLIAVVQIGIIVGSVLGAGLWRKILEGKPLPVVTEFLIHYSVLLLAVPLVWISWAAWVRVRKDTPEAAKDLAFFSGIAMVVALLVVGGYGVFSPCRSVTSSMGLVTLENEP
jgi:hypothetical protein